MHFQRINFKRAPVRKKKETVIETKKRSLKVVGKNTLRDKSTLNIEFLKLHHA